MWYFKRMNPTRIRVWLIGKRRKNFNIFLKKLSKPYNRRNPREILKAYT
jgi:hypothetical protein